MSSPVSAEIVFGIQCHYVSAELFLPGRTDMIVQFPPSPKSLLFILFISSREETKRTLDLVKQCNCLSKRKFNPHFPIQMAYVQHWNADVNSSV